MGIADEDGNILRQAGKTYVMDGSDESKLALLRTLAGSDFLSAVWDKVPANFKMNGPDGREMRGVAHASMLSNPMTHSHLFSGSSWKG